MYLNMYIYIYICIYIYVFKYVYIYIQWDTCALVLELESCGEDIFWKTLMTMNTLTFWSRLHPQNKTTFLCWKPLTFNTWWIVDDIPYSKGTVWGFMFFFHQLEFLLPQCWHSLFREVCNLEAQRWQGGKLPFNHSILHLCRPGSTVYVYICIYIYIPSLKLN